MLIDWFTVTAQIINFAVLVWLLKRFLYRPVLEAMAARERRVRETVAAADRQKAESEEEAARLRQQQAELAKEKADLLAAARADAEKLRESLLIDARQEAAARAAQWRDAAAREWQEFRTQLVERTQKEALAIARQALRELADEELEEQIAGAFLKKCAALDGGVKARLQDVARQTTRPLLVRSGFPLAEPLREKLRQALHAQLGTANNVQFETAPGVIAGIEVAFDGQKLVWTLEDFMRSLEADFDKLIQKEAKTDGAAA